MDLIQRYSGVLAEGALVTLALALMSVVLSIVLGLLGAWAKLGGGVVGRAIAGLYTLIIRGIPDLVLILLIYFGGQRLVNQMGNGFGWDYIEVSEFGAGVFAIGLIYGAYLAETFRGAWISMPRGQAEAAAALGIGKAATFRLVLVPQLIRAVLPGFANVWQVLVKSTAVVSVIGLNDLVGLADKAGKSTREPFLFFIVVILFYLALTATSETLFRQIERRGDRWAVR